MDVTRDGTVEIDFDQVGATQKHRGGGQPVRVVKNDESVNVQMRERRLSTLITNARLCVSVDHDDLKTPVNRFCVGLELLT